jgi:chromosome segregation ATPase
LDWLVSLGCERLGSKGSEREILFIMKRDSKTDKPKHRLYAIEMPSDGESLLETALKDHKEVFEWIQTHDLKIPLGRGLLGLVQDLAQANSGLKADRIRLEEEKQDLEKAIQQQKMQQQQAREALRKELQQAKEDRSARAEEARGLREQLETQQTRAARSESRAETLTEERIGQTEATLAQLDGLRQILLQMQESAKSPAPVLREMGTQTKPAAKKRPVPPAPPPEA